MRKIERLKEVPAFTNEYGTLFNDEVRGPTGLPGRYLRWKWNSDGVIVVPVYKEKFALAKMYRYSPGIFSIEFPGGGIEENETVEFAAERELIEEFGLRAEKIILLGKVNPDTGILAGSINVALALLKDPKIHKIVDTQEIMEAIFEDIIWRTYSEFKRDVAEGGIIAGTTLSAALLYLSWLEMQ